jgi:hypothetical protein
MLLTHHSRRHQMNKWGTAGFAAGQLREPVAHPDKNGQHAPGAA